MAGQTMGIASSTGGAFDLYLALPAGAEGPVPAIVLASAIHGVDKDLRDLADEFAVHVCVIWGDEDNQAPPEVLDAYRALPARMPNVEVHVFPGIKHAYMMPEAGATYSQTTREFSMARALVILDGLRGGGSTMRKAS